MFLDRGERGDANETSLEEEGGIEMPTTVLSIYAMHALFRFVLRTSDIFLILGDGNESNIVAAKGDLMEAMSSCVGNPVISIILSNWFIVDDPGKMGLPNNISPKMHPVQNSK